MSAGVVITVIVSGIAIAVPEVWSIVSVIRGVAGAWFGIAGLVWALALLSVTLINIGRDWGKDSADNKGDDDGSVVCRAGNNESENDCKPLVFSSERKS